jgi:hypothetical protein
VLGFGSQNFEFSDTYVPAGQGKLQTVANVASSSFRGSGAVTSYAYTPLGFFQTLSKTAASGSSAPVYSIVAEDAAFRPLTTTLGSAAFANSVTPGTASLTDTYYYDQLFELLEDDNTAGISKKYTDNTQTGNLVAKSDVGTYSYGGQGQAVSGPHQIASIAPSIDGTAVTNGASTRTPCLNSR